MTKHVMLYNLCGIYTNLKLSLMLMIYCNKTYVYQQTVSATCADNIFAQASFNSETGDRSNGNVSQGRVKRSSYISIHYK